MSFQKKLKKIAIIRSLASLKITLVCLALLFLLTFFGTVDQVYNGLYEAQQRFFYSFGFTILGFIPIPGAQLVLWILFVNLSCVAITRFVFNKSHIGILMIHFGLLLYFVAAFVTFHLCQESNITLLEGEGGNLSSSYNKWGLSVWKETSLKNRKQVFAYDTESLKPTDELSFNELNFKVAVKSYYSNSQAYLAEKEALSTEVKNVSGIKSLVALENEKEPEKNMPGIIFDLLKDNQVYATVLLFAGETNATTVNLNGEIYNFQLRRKKFSLPFVLKLIDFKMETHPNTEIARSYESLVELTVDNVSRQVLISMNKPLRYKDYTLYQASYAIDDLGREYSTLAVVKNAGRLLPYIASLITFLGLAAHFLLIALNSKSK